MQHEPDLRQPSKQHITMGKCIHLNPRQPAEIHFAKNWIQLMHKIYQSPSTFTKWCQPLHL